MASLFKKHISVFLPLFQSDISSLLTNSTANDFSDSSTAGTVPPATSSIITSSGVSSQSQSLSSIAPAPSSSSSTARQSSQAPPQTSNPASALVQALHKDMDLTTDHEPESLESKIHNFLQGNSAFNAFDLGFHTPSGQGRDVLSPVTGADNQDGTPVRDEGGGTPTQDEIMDKPAAAPFASSTNQTSVGETSATIYQNSSQQNNPLSQSQLQSGVTPNGQLNQRYLYGKHGMPEQGVAASVARFQQVSAPTGGPAPGDGAPGGARSSHAADHFQTGGRGWYGGDVYPEGNSQQLGGYHVTSTGGADENKAAGHYPYQAEQTQQHQEQGATTSFGFFRGTLPPVPNLPPPPQDFEKPPPMTGGAMMPQEQHLRPKTDEALGTGMDSVIRGMVVHDHQHKSMFHPEDAAYDADHTRPEELRPHPDEPHYQEDPEHYQDEHSYHDEHFFPDDAYHLPGSPPQHFPRGRGRLPTPLPGPEDPYFAPDNQWRGPRPPRFPPRRPPPHLEMRHPRLRPPHRLPYPPHPPPHPRGPPRPPFPHFHGPEMRMRVKRPDPRGMGLPGPMFGPKRPFLPPRY